MYFQWQNDVLLKTIYPLREMKLRDFLVYCQEIDLWAEYKDKKIEDLQSEIQMFLTARQKAVTTAYQSYQTQYAYFTGADVRTRYMDKYKLGDETELTKVKELHRTLMTYVPKYADVRKEKYFVTQQVSLWEQHRKSLQQEVTRRQRRLQVMAADHPRRPVETQELQKLQNVTLAIVEEELQSLFSFASSYNKIEKRKLEFYKARQSAETGSKGVRAKLDGVRARLKPLETRRREASASLSRLRTPPKRDLVEGYFSTPDVSDRLRQEFPQLDPPAVNAINVAHKQLAMTLRALKDDAVKLVTVKNHAYKLREVQGTFRKEISTLETQLRTMPANWTQRGEKQARLDMLQTTGMNAIESEMERLGDYQAAFEYAKKSQAELAQMIQAKEKELQAH
jgi:hypothetical protein